jgi:hypothetical protein
LFQFGPQQAQAFFSRRIGLRDGREVPLLGGARLYGLAGDTNIGVLAMRSRTIDGIDRENFVVTRVKHNVIDRSYIGGIFTSRSGIEGEEDRTFGLDASYVFGTNSTVFASVAKNEGRPGVESGEWFYHAFASYDTDLLSGRVAYMDIGQNYEPGIGFVPRPDQKNLSLSGSFNPRPSWELVRQMEFALDYERIETHKKVVETQKGRVAMTANFDTGDRLWIASEINDELVPAPFEIAPDVFVAGGSYGFRQVEIGGSLYEARRLTGSLSFRWGGLYGGHLSAADASLTWKPISRLHLTVENLLNKVDLPDGRFQANIHRLFASLFFGPNLSTRAAVQYSSLEQRLVLNFRLRWNYAPGSEAWFVYDEGNRFDIPGASLQSRALIVKIVHNFNR